MKRYPLPDEFRDLYIVWSHEHRAWWRANRCGYCTEFWGAGLYSEAEAKKIATDANSHGERNESAIPMRDAWAQYTEGISPASVIARTLDALRPIETPAASETENGI